MREPEIVGFDAMQNVAGTACQAAEGWRLETVARLRGRGHCSDVARARSLSVGHVGDDQNSPKRRKATDIHRNTSNKHGDNHSDKTCGGNGPGSFDLWLVTVNFIVGTISKPCPTAIPPKFTSLHPPGELREALETKAIESPSNLTEQSRLTCQQSTVTWILLRGHVSPLHATQSHGAVFDPIA